MNRNYSLFHYRFPFSSFLLFALLGEGKNARNGQAQEKSHSRFAVADWFPIKWLLISIKLLFLILGTKEEKKHQPHLKVKGGEACWLVCLLASRKRGAGAMWIRRERREKNPQQNRTEVVLG